MKPVNWKTTAFGIVGLLWLASGAIVQLAHGQHVEISELIKQALPYWALIHAADAANVSK